MTRFTSQRNIEILHFISFDNINNERIIAQFSIKERLIEVLLNCEAIRNLISFDFAKQTHVSLIRKT